MPSWDRIIPASIVAMSTTFLPGYIDSFLCAKNDTTIIGIKQLCNKGIMGDSDSCRETVTVH